MLFSVRILTLFLEGIFRRFPAYEIKKTYRFTLSTNQDEMNLSL
jgi:hypothetical protein